MIKTETIGNFIRTWSDAGYMIHGGYPEADYDEATDPIDAGRTYTETDIKIPDPEEEPTEADYAAAGKILLGESDGEEVADNE